MSARSDFEGPVFEHQVVVVTGGTRGLGAEMSRAFLDAGAAVHAVYRSDAAAATAFAETCAEHEGRLALHELDVGDHAAVEAFWGALEQGKIAVDVLVNNAGIRRDAPLALMDPETWQAVLQTNLTGGYHMAKFATLNMMGQRYGRIVFVTSPSGRFGFAGQGNYAASKAGQVGLARSLSKEVAKRGITVNCVSPGFIATELLDGLSPELLDDYRSSVPMRRFGEPREVASAVLFLASKQASYVTGATLEVSGGL